MTDFISRSDLHHIAKNLRHDAPNDNDTYFVACEVLDYVADKMPGPKPAKIEYNKYHTPCCGYCHSTVGIYNIDCSANNFCGNCGWAIDWGD